MRVLCWSEENGLAFWGETHKDCASVAADFRDKQCACVPEQAVELMQEDELGDRPIRRPTGWLTERKIGRELQVRLNYLYGIRL